LPRRVFEAKQRSASITSDEFLTPNQIRQQVADYLESRSQGAASVRPAGWRILVLVLTTPEMTEGGFLLTDDERDRRAINSPQGIVVAVGDKAYRRTAPDDWRFAVGADAPDQPWCAVGDRVLFQRYGGRTVRTFNGQNLVILNDSDISGVMDGGWL
jgi:co-chaperonin GroES (HSP10)